MKTKVSLLALAALVCLECDSGTSPVAPKAGVSFTVTAHPPKIEPFGEAEIRVVAIHAESGTPVRTGTEFRFNTDDGTVDPVAATDGDGIARATFRHNGKGQTATVSVTSGALSAQTATITIERPTVVARFSEAVSGLSVKFDSSTSTGTITDWLWDFGNGGRSTEPNPLYEYSDPGEYRVSLTVSNPDTSDSTSKLLPVGAVVAFTTAPEGNGLTIRFDSSGSTGNPTSWDWDFGDGGTSSLQNPVHTYAASGDYRVSLEIVTANAGIAATSKVIAVRENPLEAKFTETANGLTVSFNSSGSTGNPTSWAWDFGDGGTSNLQNPVHTYAASGEYRVRLEIATESGTTDDFSKVILVQETPVADFFAEVDGLTVTFTDRSTGSPTSWSWDFGDGALSTLQNPVHTYAEAGSFTVTLTVANASGESQPVTKMVQTVARLEADFSFKVNGLIVEFTNKTRNRGSGTVTWAWDFNDPAASGSDDESTKENPAYTFLNPGTYDVTLKATKSSPSEESIITKPVTVP